MPDEFKAQRREARAGVPPLAWIILAAMAARAWLLFHTPWMPGTNGAYYLVQSRALLERGTLGLPDLPLIFHLHAALAWLLARAAGMTTTEAVPWAVKLCDALLPPLAAWPVFALVRRWARSCRQGDAVPLAAAALACLAAPWFRIVGDLQKNSLALVWLALLAATLQGWLAAPTPRRGLALLATLQLLGLTHVGVLGAALVLLAATLLLFVLSAGGAAHWRRRLPTLAAGVLLLAGMAALVLWKFDPARVHRLGTALTNPVTFSADGKQMPGPPGSAPGLERFAPPFLFALAVLPALVLVWRRRKELPAADAALVAGAGLTVLAMTGPWFGMDKAIRFYLIALLPTILVAAFAALRIATPWRRRCALGLALVVGLGGTALDLPRGGRAVLDDAALRELRGLSRYVLTPERTLVSTQHGVEWWTAWFLRARVAQVEALRPEDWRRYDAVLFLTIKPGALANGPPGGGPGPSAAAPPRPGDARPAPPAGVPPPAAFPPIPPDAEVLYDSATLKLARIPTAPDFVLSGRSPASPH